MMRLYTMNQKILFIIAGILLGLLLLVIGGIVGIQYFYEDFVAAKTSLKETLGIVTEADLALIAAEAEAEEAAAQAVIDAETAALEAEAVAEAEEAAAVEAYLESLLEGTDYRTITINGQETSIDFAAESHTWFDANQMSAETLNTFVFGDISGYDVWFEGQAVQEGSEVLLEIDHLNVAYGLELKVVSQETGLTSYYYIRTLHSTYNSIAEGEGEGEGYYYFTSGTSLYKMDTAGNVVFYKDDGVKVRDFKRTEVDGEVYYSYMHYLGEDASVTAAVLYGAVIMNENYEVIDTIDYLLTEQGMPEETTLDDHEIIVLGEGHYMVISYVYQIVDNVPTDICEDGIAYVQAAVMQEIKDGEIVLQWNSTDYSEFYAYSIRVARLAISDEDLYVDYMHLNSIAIDPADDNLLLSFRSLSAIIKIDRTSGDIIWILGGEGDMFGLTEEQMMSYQHFPQVLEDGTITVFDNGNDNEQTRALEYVLDEENLTVVSFAAYQVDGIYSSSMGSAQRVSSDSATYLMGWGQADANNILFSEINFDTGEVLFQLMDLDCSTQNDASSYRAYKFDS